MVILFVTHVRPILDYCSCVWNVGHLGDVVFLESVQRKWTNRVEGLESFPYGERLRVLNLFSIKERLLRADVIKYWRILCGDSQGYDLAELFHRAPPDRTIGRRYKLFVPLCLTDAKYRFFNVRCVALWSFLPPWVVESESGADFKSSLANFFGW